MKLHMGEDAPTGFCHNAERPCQSQHHLALRGCITAMNIKTLWHKAIWLLQLRGSSSSLPWLCHVLHSLNTASALYHKQLGLRQLEHA